MSIFGIFETGRSALRAQLKGMEVSSQNVANANTPGYKRQRVNLEAVSKPVVPGIPLSPGRGVAVSGVLRIQSEFYHNQLLHIGSQLSSWQARQEAFQGIEVILMEPGEESINQFLGDFFDSWHELSSSPESTAIRMGLRELAVSLTSAVQDIYLRAEELKGNFKEELAVAAGQVNQMASEVAMLNEQLIFMSSLGDTSNELLDRIDLRLQELAGMVDIRVFRKASGAVEVFAGGRLLIQERDSFPVSVQRDQAGSLQLQSHREMPLQLKSGRLLGLQESVNYNIPNVQEQLNNMVLTLVEQVNSLHRSGYGQDGSGGRNFFRTIEDNGIPPALQFLVSEDLLADPSLIAAASRSGEPGNGEISLAIARLRDQPLASLGGSSIIDYYRGLVVTTGVDGQQSARMVQALQKAANQLEEQSQSISGVNMDEEMLQMIQFQHGWNAAARFISHVDQLIGTLFNELGR